MLPTAELRWGTERRLEFIEFRLFWEGGLNRSDVVDEFGVSIPQASKDLTLYQERALENVRYDRSLKRYFASDSFKPKFISLDADAYLEHLTKPSQSNEIRQLKTPNILPLGVEKLPIPQRRIKPDVLRSILGCVRQTRSIEILYQSMSTTRPKPIWRRISPHAFGSDGLRWHTRAFCHIDHKFKDFILSRSIDTRLLDSVGASPSDDQFWNKHFPIALRPNPRLTTSQRKVVAEDFSMENGEIVVPVRQALLYYFSKRLRLDVADRWDDPSEAPVVIKNRAAFNVALSEATK